MSHVGVFCERQDTIFHDKTKTNQNNFEKQIFVLLFSSFIKLEIEIRVKIRTIFTDCKKTNFVNY